jgi:hypothetical protein
LSRGITDTYTYPNKNTYTDTYTHTNKNTYTNTKSGSGRVL